MSHFYIKLAADHTPIEFMEERSPIGSHNTKDASANNGKPYIVPAVRTGFDPFDPATQIRTGPVLQAEPAEVQYTVRDKTARELDDEKDEETEGALGQDAGAIRQTLVDMAFEFEKRIRILEGNTPVTRAQVAAKLKALYKGHL